MTNYHQLHGKSVLLTGAAGGIGHEAAKILRSRGVTVLMTDISSTALSHVARELGSDLGLIKSADLTNVADIQELFRWAEDETGGLDGLINNAGLLSRGRLEDFDDCDWEKIIEVNMTSVYRCTKAFVKSSIANDRPGVIVNIASMAYKGMTQQIAYSSSKGGVVSMTRSSAMEMARYGIRVNAVAPGMIETKMIEPASGQKDSLRERMLSQIPLRRYGKPSEIGSAIAFLLSDDSSYVTGEVLHVSGGARL